MSRQAQQLCCSFCHKSQDVVGQLISSPSAYPRAYICDACIAVCYSIMQDDRPKREAEVQAIRVPEVQASEESSRFSQHPLTGKLLVAAERWALRDFAGLDASSELDYMRELAAMMLTE